MLDSISRAVMRNPSPEAQQLLVAPKTSLDDFFKDKTDTEIEWVLANATESRGHFTKAQAVRDFCSGKITASHSADIGAIADLLSAISYSVPQGEISLDDKWQNIKM